MTPGTRPSRRTARAAPLPARARAVALSSLTLAMMSHLLNKNELRGSRQGPDRVGALIPAAAWKHKKRCGFRLRRGAGTGGGLQLLDARPQDLVLLAGEARHFLDSLELLALHHVEIAQDALR